MAGPLRIPTLDQRSPIVDKDGRATTEFLRKFNDALKRIVELLNQIAALPEIQEQLANLDETVAAAQEAIEAAQQAADAATQQTEAQKREAAIQSSYIDPASVLTADPTTITIAAHTRFYGDGTSAPVNGGMIAASAPSDVDFVFYDDPDRDGGAVTYQLSTTPPVQTGDRHVVGAVTIPAAGTQDGGEGPRRPGFVEP